MSSPTLSRTAAQKAQPADTILDIAENLAQTRGFNGFSYADIAVQMHVTKASLHYHFPSKADLGRSLIERYRSTFRGELEAIDRKAHGAGQKLRRYAQLYDSVMRNDRMCLCGMLAAEYTTLPVPMQAELRKFFDDNELWLTGVLAEGRRTGTLKFRDAPDKRARTLVSSLEGAMLVARAYGDGSRFRTAMEHALSDVGLNHTKGPTPKRV